MPVGESCYGRRLRYKPSYLKFLHVGIEYVLCIRIEGRKGSDGRKKHAHRMRVVAESVHELPYVFMHVGVMSYVVNPAVVLRFVRQFTVNKKVSDFEEVTFFRQLFYRVSPVSQDSLFSVNEGNPAFARSGIPESGVVTHHAKVFVLNPYLAKVSGFYGIVVYSKFVCFTCPVILYRQSVLRHLSISSQ